MKVEGKEDEQAATAVKPGAMDSEDNQRKSTLSLAKPGTGVGIPKKRQKLQPFKFLPPDSFGKSKPGMLEQSGKLQQMKSFPKPQISGPGQKDQGPQASASLT